MELQVILVYLFYIFLVIVVGAICLAITIFIWDWNLKRKSKKLVREQLDPFYRERQPDIFDPEKLKELMSNENMYMNPTLKPKDIVPELNPELIAKVQQINAKIEQDLPLEFKIPEVVIEEKKEDANNKSN